MRFSFRSLLPSFKDELSKVPPKYSILSENPRSKITILQNSRQKMIHTPTSLQYFYSSKCLKIQMSLLTQQIQPEKFWHCDDVTGWPRYNGSCPESYKTTKAWYSKPTSQASVTQDWHRGWNMCQLEMMPSSNRGSLKSLLTPFFSDILVSKVWWVATIHDQIEFIRNQTKKLLHFIGPCWSLSLFLCVPNQREHPQSPGTGLHQRPTLEPKTSIF